MLWTPAAMAHHENPRIDSLQRVLQRLENAATYDSSMIFVLGELAHQYRLSDPSRALQLIERAREIAVQLDRPSLIGSTYFQMGQVLRANGKTYMALDRFLQAYRIQIEANIDEGLDFILIEIANAYYALGDYELPAEFYRRAADNFIRKGHTFGATVAWNNLGLVAKARGQLDSALYWFHRALAARDTLGEPFLVAHSLAYIGQVHALRGDMAEVRRTLERAEAAYERSNPSTIGYELPQLHVSLLELRGRMHAASGEHLAAVGAWSTAHAMADSISNSAVASYNATLLAQHYLDHGRLDSAAWWVGHAETEARAAGDLLALRQLMDLRAEIALRNGDKDEAIRAIRASSQLSDSLRQFQHSGKYAEIRAALDLLGYEKENELLREKNANDRLMYGGLSAALFLIIVVILIGWRLKRRSDRQLGDLRSMLSAAFEQSPIPMALIDAPDRTIRIINSACTSYLGLGSASGLIGTRLDDLERTWIDIDANGTVVPGPDMPLSRALRGEVINNVEYGIRLPNGAVRWELVSAAPVYNGDGTLIAAYLAFPDITDRKVMEEALRASRDAAHEANQAKSTFLANMSHEIRTPLNAVLGFGELLREHVHDTEGLEYLSGITTAGDGLLTLINDILDLSKIEAGRLEMHPEPLDLRALCGDMQRIFAHKVAEKRLDFHLDVDADTPDRILLDGQRLRQVLLNLIGNAVKFTDAGRVDLRVRATASGAGLTDLRIDVEDTGVGIPADQQDLIFEAFRQRDGQSTRRYGGTGLGLTITKRLVEMMGGTLSLSSSAGAGATFTVHLHGIPVPASLPAVELSPDARIVLTGGSILLAEDIASNRLVVTGMLRSFPVIIGEVEDGAAAVDHVRRHKPDLVLMDLHMPVMDGFDAIRALRADESTRSIPIIALSASTSPEHADQIRSLCDGFLRKPVRRDDLIAELCRFLPHRVLPVRTDGQQKLQRMPEKTAE